MRSTPRDHWYPLLFDEGCWSEGKQSGLNLKSNSIVSLVGKYYNMQIVVRDQLTLINIRIRNKQKLRATIGSHGSMKYQVLHEVANSQNYAGDLWECLHVVFTMFWGAPNQTGSLCHLREIARRTLVDKGVKVFNVGNEFLLHTFYAHFTASILTLLGTLAAQRIMFNKHLQRSGYSPNQKNSKQVYCMRSGFWSSYIVCSCIVDLREAIIWENGPVIVQSWIQLFVATGWKNHACKAVYQISNLTASFPKHVLCCHQQPHCQHTSGKPGKGKPMDQLIEHYNL